MTFHSPLRYPGGKNSIFNFIASIICENKLIGSSYAEPYAGGSGLALRLLFEEYVEKIFINDLDVAIYAFWKSIINYPDKFCIWINDVEINLESWAKYKKIYDHKNDVDLFELGKATFFLNRTNISGILKGGLIGGKKQEGNYKMDARFNKQSLIKRIQKISKYTNRIFLSNQDGDRFINTLNKEEQNIFFYFDPPYYKKGKGLYMNYFSKKDHEQLKKAVTCITTKWMMSYDNEPFILGLYPEMRKIIYQLSHSTSNRICREILIFSNNLNVGNSIKYLHKASSI